MLLSIGFMKWTSYYKGKKEESAATIFKNLLVLEVNILTFAVSLFRQNKN